MTLKKSIEVYLATQRLMSVATHGTSPWIANVYYVHDKNLHLFFISKKWREHCKAIERNPHVAVAIADSHQPIYKPQKGIQCYGIASRVSDITKLTWMFDLWNMRVAGKKGEHLDNPKHFLEFGAANVYEISPKRIKFFNTELWPKDQVKILDQVD